MAEEGLVCSTRDDFLLKFLRAKKFDYEKSFKMVQRYCAMRSRSPQNFQKCLPSLAKDTLDCQLQTVLPHRDALARRVLIFKVGKWDTVTTTPEQIFRQTDKYIEDNVSNCVVILLYYCHEILIELHIYLTVILAPT